MPCSGLALPRASDISIYLSIYIYYIHSELRGIAVPGREREQECFRGSTEAQQASRGVGSKRGEVSGSSEKPNLATPYSATAAPVILVTQH